MLLWRLALLASLRHALRPSAPAPLPRPPDDCPPPPKLFATPEGETLGDPACNAGDAMCDLATRDDFDLYECIDYDVQLIVDYDATGDSPISDALSLSIAPSGACSAGWQA